MPSRPILRSWTPTTRRPTASSESWAARSRRCRTGSMPRPMHSRWTSWPRATWGFATQGSRASCERLATGSATPARVEGIDVDEPLADWRGPYHNDVSAFLSILALPVYVWGSGRGTLFVPEMDEKAFPPLKPAGSLLRLGRGAMQRLLGLRHPR